MLFLLLLFLSVQTARANYRHYFLDNADICGLSTGKTRLKIGTGAVRFELSGPSTAIAPFYKYKQQKCEIDVEAPPGFGIIAYIEDMHMRKSSKGKPKNIQLEIPFRHEASFRRFLCRLHSVRPG